MWQLRSVERPAVVQGFYTAFKRLEESGYIVSYWGDSGAGARRRYYTITPAGREVCRQLLAEWTETKEIMDKLLKTEAAQ